MTSHKRPHLPALDGVRGFAALTVFLFHYGGGRHSSNRILRLAAEVIHAGWSGVSLFLVLSGFLITGILWDAFGHAGWWGRFYVRRSLRIFPLYYLALLLAIVAAFVVGLSRQSLDSSWVFLFYLQNIPFLRTHDVTFSPVLPVYHFWSLAVEEQFYIFWPILLSLMTGRRQAKILCVAVWLISLAFRIAVVTHHLDGNWGGAFLLGRMGELSMGCWLALSMRGPERGTILRASPWLLPISLVAIILLASARQTTDIYDSWIMTLGLVLFGLLSASLLVQSLAGGLVQRFFETRMLQWLGKISYGIYVYHLLFRPFFYWVVRRLFPPLGYDAGLLELAGVAAVGTLATASLSYYFFEAKFLSLKKKLAP